MPTASPSGAEPGDYLTLAHDSQSNPVDLAHALDEKTDRQWRDWLPVMLREYCKLAEDDVQQLDKILATQVACTNADVFTDWHLFNHCCVAFNHRRVNFEWLDVPSCMETAWACEVLRTLRPNVEFGMGVLRYITSLMLDDGFVFFPWVGGEGLSLCSGPGAEISKGLVDCHDLARDVSKVWKAGTIQHAESADDVDETDPHHVQLAKLINAQAYIRAQAHKAAA